MRAPAIPQTILECARTEAREEAARRHRDRAALIEERRIAAGREVTRLVELFRTIDPDLGRIVLFGSLATGRITRPDFDIDLSFEGKEYYACVAAALESPFRVDLIDYRAAAPHIRDAVDRQGVIVHDPQRADDR